MLTGSGEYDACHTPVFTKGTIRQEYSSRNLKSFVMIEEEDEQEGFASWGVRSLSTHRISSPNLRGRRRARQVFQSWSSVVSETVALNFDACCDAI
jgi:hypothetical protein